MRVNRRGDEQGAIAIMVAVLMVLVLGLAAFTVDYGAYSVQQRRVQNAADAAALAIARECAKAPAATACLTGSAGAPYVTSNADARATGTPQVNVAGSSVTVQVNRPVDMTFARLGELLSEGEPDPTASARSKASWNNIPSRVEGQKFLPVGVNICTYVRSFTSPGQFPTNERVIQGAGLTTLGSNVGSGISCTAPTGGTYTNQLDRFAWLTGIAGLVDLVDVNVCNYRTTPLTTNFVSIALNDLLAPLVGCSGVISRLRIGDEIVLPIFESRGLTNGVRIVGFAGFQITGWKFGILGSSSSASPPCSSILELLRTCIEGRFIRDTDNSAAIAYTKPGGLALNLGLLKIRIEDLSQ